MIIHLTNNNFKIPGEPFKYRLARIVSESEKPLEFESVGIEQKRKVCFPLDTKCSSTLICRFIGKGEKIPSLSDVLVLRYGKLIFSQVVLDDGIIVTVKLYGDKDYVVSVDKSNVVAYTHRYHEGHCLNCNRERPRVRV